MRTSDLDIVIVPGLNNSGADHWQSRWQTKLATARRVEQKNWARPHQADWVEQILKTTDKASKPILLIGHSLGVPAIIHAAQHLAPARIAGAFLVAPPDLDRADMPEEIRSSFADMPLTPLPFTSVLVASQTDPYCQFERAQHFAQHWGATFTDAGDAGHINADSGHGPWPEGLMRLAGFLRTLPHP